MSTMSLEITQSYFACCVQAKSCGLGRSTRVTSLQVVLSFTGIAVRGLSLTKSSERRRLLRNILRNRILQMTRPYLILRVQQQPARKICIWDIPVCAIAETSERKRLDIIGG